VPAAPCLVRGGADPGDERFGDAGVAAVEEGAAGDVGFLADLEGGDVLAVAVDELFDERAVAVDVAGA
jgi:hypothetical protein